MTSRLALALALSLILGACGAERAAERASGFLPVPGLPWAQVTQEQLDAAKAMGVPVAREHAGALRLVYIPAGTFERVVDGERYVVNIGVGFYIQVDAGGEGMSHSAAESAAVRHGDATWSCRLPTEAEWEHAQRFLPSRSPLREWMLDRFGPLPTWIVSDPHGPREGATRVVRDGARRTGLSPGTRAKDLGYRLVSPLGYGLGAYGATKVTFRLVDEFASGGSKPIPGGYDLRVISMNDRLQARTLGVETRWTLVPEPGSPVTLSMVPGAYYVYAERTWEGHILRGKEMKFYVADAPVERTVPIPEKDQKRYGSGGREKPQ